MTAPEQSKTVALIPVKAFAMAKRRLAAVLTVEERAELAEAMLRDVIAALQSSGAIDGVGLLGGEDARRLADSIGLSWLDDGGEPDLNIALDQAADTFAREQLHTLLVLPGDLPTVQSENIAALLACHQDGLTLTPARSDGGTNALVVSPPDAMDFCFGPDSARRHLAYALTAGLPAQQVKLEAFARDIDGPADLRWLCRQASGEYTHRWLTARDIDRRLGNTGQSALQA